MIEGDKLELNCNPNSKVEKNATWVYNELQFDVIKLRVGRNFFENLDGMWRDV